MNAGPAPRWLAFFVSCVAFGCGAGDAWRAPSLTSLSVSAGALAPAFAPDVLDYTVTVTLLTESFSVTPVVDPPDATITVDGMAVASGALSPATFLALGENTISIEVTSADGLETRVYTVVVERAPTVLQDAYVKASNTGVSDMFSLVALSGDTLAVGASIEASGATGVDGNQADDSAWASGAVYVFVRDGAVWSQEAYLKASNTGAEDLFGWSLALSGDTLAVGAPHEDGSATGVDGNQADDSAAQSGAVYVFVRSGAAWSQQAYLKASNTGAWDKFGYSVSLLGDTLAVGAVGESSSATGVGGEQADDSAAGSGAVYIFGRSGGVWSQQAYLKASNTGADDAFGVSVSLSGDTLAVGAVGEASSATGVDGDQADDSLWASGAAYVFVRSEGAWSQQAYLKASNTGQNDAFGLRLSLSGDTLAVGAYGEESSATGVDGNQADNSAWSSGAVYVFLRSGAAWSQQAYLKASNTDERDGFGGSVSLFGDMLAVGAGGESSSAIGVGGDQTDDSAWASGAVYLFVRTGAVWSQQVYLKASNTAGGDGFAGVSLVGDTLAVGAAAEASGATGVGGDQGDDSVPNSGAVYVFR